MRALWKTSLSGRFIDLCVGGARARASICAHVCQNACVFFAGPAGTCVKGRPRACVRAPRTHTRRFSRRGTRGTLFPSLCRAAFTHVRIHLRYRTRIRVRAPVPAVPLNVRLRVSGTKVALRTSRRVKKKSAFSAGPGAKDPCRVLTRMCGVTEARPRFARRAVTVAARTGNA